MDSIGLSDEKEPSHSCRIKLAHDADTEIETEKNRETFDRDAKAEEDGYETEWNGLKTEKLTTDGVNY